MKADHRKRVVLLLLIGLPLLSFAQDFGKKLDADIFSILEDYKSSSIDEVKSHDFDNTFKLKESGSSKNNLDFGYWDVAYGFHFDNYDLHDSNVANYRNYQIHTIVKNDEIILLYAISSDKNSKQCFFDTVKVERYLDLHNKFYNASTTIEDLKNALISDRRFGTMCGATQYSVPQYQGLFFDEVKHRPTFNAWLQSHDPVLQTYGVTALEYLNENKNIALTPEEIKMITQIRRRNSTISLCAGCTSQSGKAFKS